MQELPIVPLPLAEQAGLERADAARNRERILAVAQSLVRDRGIEHVSMDDVARTACVGTGTLYRRFGDRAGLALALLDEQTRVLQEAMLIGPPPLGPGAPARDRLQAFGAAYLDLLEGHAPLLLAADRPARSNGGPHGFWVLHVTILLREAAPDLDHDFTARALLATLSASLHAHAREELGWPLERLRAGWDDLVAALCEHSATC